MASPSATQISAPGLSAEQLLSEQAWLNEFNQAADSLNWLKWEKFWSDDAFLQFGNEPKFIGKSSIADYFSGQLGVLELMHHEIRRHSIDVPSGLIYQTARVTYRIKGDTKARIIEVPGIAVIHKKMGSNVVTGFETYIDKEPISAVVKEVLLAGTERP